MTLLELNRFFATLPGPYALRVSRDYMPEMDALRMTGDFVGGNHSSITNQDAFDARAWHLGVYLGSTLAGCSRLIPGPNAYFRHFLGPGALPDYAGSADWSRLVVAPAFRGAGLPLALGLGAQLLASALSRQVVNGSTEPHRQLPRLLHDLGFTEAGPPLGVQEATAAVRFQQPFCCDLAALPYDPAEQLAATWARLRVPDFTK